MLRSVMIAVLGMTTSACGDAAQPTSAASPTVTSSERGESPSASTEASIVPLPAIASPPTDSPFACAGIGLDAVLRGSPADERITWLENRSSGDRIEAVWPPGYSARFSPELEVFDATGRLVYTEGASITGACTTDQDNTVLMQPPPE